MRVEINNPFNLHIILIKRIDSLKDVLFSFEAVLGINR